jgi:hypothetical protein
MRAKQFILEEVNRTDVKAMIEAGLEQGLRDYVSLVKIVREACQIGLSDALTSTEEQLFILAKEGKEGAKETVEAFAASYPDKYRTNILRSAGCRCREPSIGKRRTGDIFCRKCDAVARK